MNNIKYRQPEENVKGKYNLGGGENMKLRKYQIEAVEAMLAFDKCLCVAPTGSGKTVMIGAILEHLSERTLIIVTQSKLKKQMADTIRQFDLPEPVILNNKKPESGLITIATWQSLASKKAVIPEGINCIISDEAHHISNMTIYGHIVNMIGPKYHYAFTATAMRKDGIKELLKLCNYSRVQIEYEDLYAQHYLHRPQVYFISTGKHYNVDDHLNTWQCENFSDEQKLGVLKKVVGTDSSRNYHLLRHIYSNINTMSGAVHALILSFTVQQSEYLYNCWTLNYNNAVGINLSPYLIHGRRGVHEKREYFRKIMEADNSITFATQSFLGEGVDIPKLNMLFITTPFGGGAKTIQFAGRILRLHPGKTQVRIYDYYDAMSGIGEHWLNARKSQYKKLSAGIKEE